MERLRHLLRLRAALDQTARRLDETAAELDAEIEAEREEIAESEARRRRRAFKRIVAIPAGIGLAVAALRDWVAANRRVLLAATGGVATGAAGTAIIITQLGPHHAPPPPRAAAPRPHASAPPHASRPTRPPRTSGPGAAPRHAVPAPGVSLPAVPPVPTPIALPRRSAHPPSDPTTTPPAGSVQDAKDCRIRLPRLLNRGLVCGRLR